jgi:hypothetical protein
MTWRNVPDEIETLPDMVPLIKIMDQAGKPHAKRVQAVVGQNINLHPALFNLKRMGPHFAVVGPPLSGKTTTLYSWVLSLTQRYSPEQIMIVLVDLQQRFIIYGGEQRLDALPHVVTAVTDVEQIEALVSNLKSECRRLAAEDNERELFVIIDNFDDFAEEVERMRDAARDLAGLARRYGRDGLHFIAAGALDSTGELRRRIQQNNYGIGLRTAQAVDTLRVTRRPAGFRGKELPPGRGFIVKSGIPTMIQVATPYEGMDVTVTGTELEDEEEKNAQALDKWVAKIQKKYPKQQAEWSEPLPDSADGSGETAVASETKPYIDMLRRIIYQQADGNADEIAGWDDSTVLIEFAKDALKETTGMDPSFFGTTAKDILDNVIGMLPELPKNGDKTDDAPKEKQK